MRLDDADGHVHALSLEAVALLQHLVGLADAGGKAEVDLEPAALLVADQRQELLGLRPIASGIDRARGERQSPFPRDLEAAPLDGAADLGIGPSGHGLAVHLAGPQNIEVLADRAGSGRRRHDEAEEHADLDRSERGSDVGPDEERPDRELGLGRSREEDLPVGGARRRDERQRRDDRALKS